ncbi:TetR/AcrR family transcriptional regulator [Ornithinimicrobium cavernae]|uniref:TetR/AcrR family transcriptional regulator n=1 Tax=Ornithinimicrobium cavernae TaxID=2666047 RepID=UPI000D691944|nr:TetR/AcrR family transcriptional regulator [Ornithinimicrobium cavernae]
MPPRTRTRMSTDARRGQLLQIGAELFATTPYDAVRITEVADRAGVSRGLLYHYFPTKREFAIAVTQSVCSDVFHDAQPDGGWPVEQQLRFVLDAYVRFAEENRAGYRAMHRGLIADPEVRELRRQDLARDEQRVLEAFGALPEPPEVLRLAVRGWLALVIALCLEWLDGPAVDRDALLDLMVGSLLDLVRGRLG